MGSDSVLEIRECRAAIIACLGDPAKWSPAPLPQGAAIYPVAPGERWIFAPARTREQLLAWARTEAKRIGGTAYAADVSDGWSIWCVDGTVVCEVWSRLSENKAPSGRPTFVQGAIAHVPAKSIVEDRAVHFCVPSPLGHHLTARLFEACADLNPQLKPATDLMIGGAMVAPINAAPGEPTPRVKP